MEQDKDEYITALLNRVEDLEGEVVNLEEEVDRESETVQCCPHCPHKNDGTINCDGNCDFHCRKAAKKDDCDGTECGAASCKQNHRTHFTKASDLIDFMDSGGIIGEDIVRVVK